MKVRGKGYSFHLDATIIISKETHPSISEDILSTFGGTRRI
jgi:hypothetical protein